MPRIKLNYPTGDTIAETLYKRLAPQPGDVVIVFDSSSGYVANFTILEKIDNDDPKMPFVAPLFLGEQTFHWTYAYKVPEGYASAEA